ncbi:F-box only protein 30a [Callorhinchus milii]|uniref:F-box only protein 30 n=1 Tax=Callorhinchus milii TaxID=7868 RepID=A0A4W3HL88_CALMI|nr:F-box only protein 30a [Callorhinchus milii]XP_042189489.1 F-box only protein 30a [Callorhinchus milii]|eukprot:gi/632953897/ref/XP_007892673.1/ PREDICTED: F-box only protein 30 [Callorhinchus milii]
MEQHSHCVNCVSRRCMVRPEGDVSCDLIGCPLVCGAVFHSCKADEHRLLCPLERVPCLNNGFGCPYIVARNKIAEHLEVCPASVVCCTMEWNRWPVSYADRKSYESLSKDGDGVDQLDMALALQDQRMLLESLKVVTTVSRSSDKHCGNAEPISVSISPDKHFGNAEPISVTEETSEKAHSNGLLSLDEETYNELYRATVETTRSLAAALDILNNATKDTDLVNGTISEEQSERVGNAQAAGDDNSEGSLCIKLRGDSHQNIIDEGAVGDKADSVAIADDLSSRNMNVCVEENGFGVLSGMVATGDADEHIRVKTSALCNGFYEMEVTADTLDQDKMDTESSDKKQAEGAMNGSSHESDMECDSNSSEPDRFLPVFARLLTVETLLQHERFHEDTSEHLPSGVKGLENRPFEERLALKNAATFKLLEGFNGRRPYVGDLYRYRKKMEDKSVDTSDLEKEDDPLELQGIDLITAALLFCLGDSPSGRGISDSRSVDGNHINSGTQTFSFPTAILATNTMVGEIASASACDHATPQLSNPSPFQTLGLDLVLECVTRYQTKQRSMFTFVCGQLFRRDEFSSHFKNVHGDIHAGLNGWMEHRCPLAYYGCTYSQRRFCPSAQGSKVIHDRHLKSFGVQLQVPPGLLAPTTENRNLALGAAVDQLRSLPFEILQHIAGFLDGFSLSQLSKVSHLMREVCASLLQVRGMVILLWEKRQRSNGMPSWQIKSKAWRFSTAFGTVNEWKFADITSMADHLKSCTYNTVERRDEAIPLPCMCVSRDLTKGGLSLRSVLKPVL